MVDVSCQTELMFGFVSRRGVIFVIFRGSGTSSVVRLIRFVVFRFMARTWHFTSFLFAGWSDSEDPSAGRFLDSGGEFDPETSVDVALKSDSSAECCEGLGGKA